MNLSELSQKLEDHLTDQDIQDAQELLDDTYQEIVDMRGELVEAQAEMQRLRAELEGRDNHTMIWRREIINPSMAHMGAALVALRNGDPDTAQQYLETWLDAGGVCYERYTSHEVFFKRFHTDFMCDQTDKEACLAEIAEFNRCMTEDQEQSDEN